MFPGDSDTLKAKEGELRSKFLLKCISNRVESHHDTDEFCLCLCSAPIAAFILLVLTV